MDSGGCDLDLGGTAHYIPPSLVSEHQYNNPPLTVTRKEQTEGRGETPRNYSGSQGRRGGAGQKKHQGIPSPVLGELVTVEIQARRLRAGRDQLKPLSVGGVNPHDVYDGDVSVFAEPDGALSGGRILARPAVQRTIGTGGTRLGPGPLFGPPGQRPAWQATLNVRRGQPLSQDFMGRLKYSRPGVCGVMLVGKRGTR